MPDELRFEREAQLLAQIEHPAVARLVDAGVENGRAWIAMEFVNGLRIDDYCRAKNSNLPTSSGCWCSWPEPSRRRIACW